MRTHHLPRRYRRTSGRRGLRPLTHADRQARDASRLERGRWWPRGKMPGPDRAGKGQRS